MTKVLFLRGLPDDNHVTASLSGGKISFAGFGGANVLQATQYFREKTRVFEAHFFGAGPDEMPGCPVLPDLIFNEISDPDTHGIALGRAERFCQLFQVPVLNPPPLVRRLTRDYLSAQTEPAAETREEGLIIPKTVRCQLTDPNQIAAIAGEQGIEFPVLVRVAGKHGGNTLVRLETPTDFARVHALPMDGRDFYLSEFVDCRGRDDLYRKYRIAMVGGQPILRHYIIGKPWLVNAGQRKFMDMSPHLLEEERQVMETFAERMVPRIRPWTDRLYQIAGLDYFGIDADFTEDGKMVVFEVNANMNIMITDVSMEMHDRAVRTIAHAVEDLIRSRCQ